MSVEKVVRNGEVAVLISPGFGSGWSTWTTEHRDILLFHPKLVEWVEKGKGPGLENLLNELGAGSTYVGSNVEDLEVRWLPEGTAFYVHEYDGSESIVTGEDLYVTA
jgi:hypothetical protein